jgi:hypothetical protein
MESPAGLSLRRRVHALTATAILPDSFSAASSSVSVVIGGGAAAEADDNARRADPSLLTALRANDAIGELRML